VLQRNSTFALLVVCVHASHHITSLQELLDRPFGTHPAGTLLSASAIASASAALSAANPTAGGSTAAGKGAGSAGGSAGVSSAANNNSNTLLMSGGNSGSVGGGGGGVSGAAPPSANSRTLQSLVVNSRMGGSSAAGPEIVRDRSGDYLSTAAVRMFGSERFDWRWNTTNEVGRQHHTTTSSSTAVVQRPAGRYTPYNRPSDVILDFDAYDSAVFALSGSGGGGLSAHTPHSHHSHPTTYRPLLGHNEWTAYQHNKPHHLMSSAAASASSQKLPNSGRRQRWLSPAAYAGSEQALVPVTGGGGAAECVVQRMTVVSTAESEKVLIFSFLILCSTKRIDRGLMCCVVCFNVWSVAYGAEVGGYVTCAAHSACAPARLCFGLHCLWCGRGH
jgi:hypothetical protein